MEISAILSAYGDEMYFFTLKKVRNEDYAQDILQNAYVKIHQNLHQLENKSKVRAWVFQILRNEIVDFLKQESLYTEEQNDVHIDNEIFVDICCFNKFIDELPHTYKKSVQLIYLEGKKQTEAAAILNITLPNIKIRIKRAKEILKERLVNCCKYQVDKNGNLVGDSDCLACQSNKT
ncbi:sigma-70 family RNA polymerase sigma factor [Elizabethkingia ursingii]|uniref:RNA polymerase subunit sigma-70 n=1 Tax=Elizabethkingia ursingii TaxID=1756150 RepID=A0ABX3N4E6_9FLAO|nr:sigma-70 family RNA polymerase sigma factor [Elizabethkingia ursingii]OPB84395.1 RNA polymerase subunit sigma-70 [Elizabethkingia ursingii]